MSKPGGNGRAAKTPRFYFALAAAKMTRALVRLAGRSGGQLPGAVALKLCPDFLSRIGLPQRTVFVTGTNGKTTTSNLVADLLSAQGMRPLVNREGGNVTEGIASTLIKDATMGGRARSEIAVLELDERCSRLVFPHITPDLLVVTNLYRDTFTRNAHVGFVFDILSQSIPSDTQLILNADDLISGRLAPQVARRTYYSLCELAEDTSAPEGIVSDLTACPECGGHLRYEYCHVGHIGRVSCMSCGLSTPPAAYEAVAVDRGAHTMTVCEHEHAGEPSASYRFRAGSVTDLYNLLAAISCVRELGVSSADIASALEGGVGIVASRYNEVVAGGKRLVSIASKGENGMACSLGFANIRGEQGDKAVVLMLEDYYLAKDPTSTEFIGWLYETDFEYLSDPSIKQVVITGVRSEDMLLRVLCAGIDPARVVCAKDGIAAADVVDYQHVDAVYYAHAIHNEHPAQESRDHLARLIEGREVA